MEHLGAEGDRASTTSLGGTVDLTAREFSLLETFMRHPKQVLSREQLLSRVWGLSFDPNSNLVDVYMGRLRRKLSAASAADHIVTLRGMGYRFDPTPECESTSGGPESA